MSDRRQYRSEIPLASAERLASSGMTNQEIAKRSRAIGADLAKKNFLLINLNDSTITISQYDRAMRLIREIYPNAFDEGNRP